MCSRGESVFYHVESPFWRNLLMSDLSPIPSNVAPVETTTAAPEPSIIRKIFVGPSGIRAGWRLLMYVAMVAITALLLNFVFQGRHPNHLWSFFLAELFGAITLLLASLRSLHGFYFGHLALHGVRIIKFAVFWGVVFLPVGFFEEYLLRGYTQFTLASGIGFWPAAALLSASFGALHLSNKG